MGRTKGHHEERKEHRRAVTVRLGVSACLIGERVRWNNGHDEEPLLTKTLAPFIEWVPVCPEVEAGLGVPRPMLRLQETTGGPRLVESDHPERDHTDALQTASTRWLEQASEVDGFILKKGSPSCAPDRAKLYRDGSPPRGDATGLFATALAATRPLVPTIDEGRLRDPGLREGFFDRVFAHARLRELGERPATSALQSFHARHKYTLLSHDPSGTRELGRLLADPPRDRAQLRLAYGRLFFAALAKPATRAKHSNVLQHIQGFLKGKLDPTDALELGDLIAQHRAGLIPLVVPVTLLRHHLRRSDAPLWVRIQTYLDPYPNELMLRNHA